MFPLPLVWWIVPATTACPPSCTCSYFTSFSPPRLSLAKGSICAVSVPAHSKRANQLVLIPSGIASIPGATAPFFERHAWGQGALVVMLYSYIETLGVGRSHLLLHLF